MPSEELTLEQEFIETIREKTGNDRFADLLEERLKLKKWRDKEPEIVGRNDAYIVYPCQNCGAVFSDVSWMEVGLIYYWRCRNCGHLNRKYRRRPEVFRIKEGSSE